jgi:hypothetical protein
MPAINLKPLTGFQKLFPHQPNGCQCDLCNPRYYLESAKRFIDGLDIPPPWMTVEECARVDLDTAVLLVEQIAGVRPKPTLLLEMICEGDK